MRTRSQRRTNTTPSRAVPRAVPASMLGLAFVLALVPLEYTLVLVSLARARAPARYTVRGVVHACADEHGFPARAVRPGNVCRGT